MTGVNNDEGGWSLCNVRILNYRWNVCAKQFPDEPIKICFILLLCMSRVPIVLCSSKLDRGSGSGADREHDFHFLPWCKTHTAWHYNITVSSCSNFSDRCVDLFLKPKDAVVIDLTVDEYIGASEDRVKNRKGFTEALGDMLFTIPAIKTANAHRGMFIQDNANLRTIVGNSLSHFHNHTYLLLDAGAPVYLYEYQHPPKFLQAKRPSFVGSDHADEIFTVLGLCFTTTHVTLAGKFNFKKSLF